MKNETLIKDYLDEKDKLINDLVKDLKEHFSIYILKKTLLELSLNAMI